MRPLLLCFLLLFGSGIAEAKDTLRIAVASNFQQTLATLIASYQASHSDSPKVTLVPGSTGKLYAQIVNGAPFDAFFAADSKRPALLATDPSLATFDQFSYAHGVLALWVPNGAGSDLGTTVKNLSRFAMANPELAPYGLATAQTLEALEISERQNQRIVGSNIGQTFSFVKTGAVAAGFVSFSQLRQLNIPSTQYIVVDNELHKPIEQQAISLSNDPTLKEFMDYCKSEPAIAIIVAAGYLNPRDS